MLAILDGYRERAGLLRARILDPGRKARLAEILSAQARLDHDGELVARDPDFVPFAAIAGLKRFSVQRR